MLIYILCDFTYNLFQSHTLGTKIKNVPCVRFAYHIQIKITAKRALEFCPTNNLFIVRILFLWLWIPDTVTHAHTACINFFFLGWVSILLRKAFVRGFTRVLILSKLIKYGP